MKIIADENLAQVASVFGNVGELVTLPGRAIDAAAVRDADALLVRSVTKVDARLLEGSRCRFVGTATSGIDHIDADWLQKQGIALSWARGCNAWSVVDYVFSALAHLSERDGFDWRQLSYGIVGCGEIGSRLAKRLLSLGIRVVINDPFLDSNHALATRFGGLDAALQQDVVTFHTPLTRYGPWPTWHMLDAQRIARLRPDTILINAARGGVIDNVALLAHMEAHPGQRVVLDAWENEPNLLLPLLQRVALGTAHIAGYSVEGKTRGTQMIAQDFTEYFGVQLASAHVVPVGNHCLKLERSLPALQQLNHLMLQVYDVSRDDALLRQTLTAKDPALQFDLLRKTYTVRHEFNAYTQPQGLAPDIGSQAARLGFRRLPDEVWQRSTTAGSAPGNA